MRRLELWRAAFSLGDVALAAALFAAWPILTLAGWLARRRAARFDPCR